MVYLSTFIFSLFIFLSGSVADDAAVMEKLAAAISPIPSNWKSTTNNSYCNWDGVSCHSNRVTGIDLASKSLSGTLPSDLNSLSQLSSLSLQRNSFSGPLPSLSNLSFLQTVFLDFNNFTSIPPSFFTGLTSLQTLSLSQNINLEAWLIPTELTQSSTLVNFSASNTNIFGSLPDFFDSFPSLQNLRLSYNNLTGSLPPSLEKSGIQNLLLNGQELGLSGSIEVLSTMTELYQAWLHDNQFTGQIPDLSKCQNLFDLQLRENKFTGIVPSSLMQLPNLQNVSLDNNRLQGPLPVFKSNAIGTFGGINRFCRTTPGDCDPQVTVLLSVAEDLGYPYSLADSWQDNDACRSWLYVQCTKENVTTVNFGKRGFNGTISSSFANLTWLQNLFLNDNNLSGSIPDSLTTLTHLKVLDVSNNNLSGQIPKFATTVNLTTSGNSLLGTTLSPGTGGNGGNGGDRPSTNATSPSGFPSGSSNRAMTGIIAGVASAVVLFVVVLLFVMFKLYSKSKRKKDGKTIDSISSAKAISKSDIGSTVIGSVGLMSETQSQSSSEKSDFNVSDGGNVAISIQVLRQVTNNFSEDNVLGRGGFGVVYKGELHDGTNIAVKRMQSVAMGTKGLKEFEAEIAVLTKVRHRHLVALLGYCINGDERLLVYEYMPQGTLTQHLFDWSENKLSPITWKQRVTIALDVARGVEYLHRLAQQSFIHRDLKPSNILLGNDMRAKVADFGLVRNAPDGKYSVETRLAGTFGYLAPEYAATGRVTTKVDVYAFGVVLMELITGRRALDDAMPDETSHLVTWFRRVLINKENIPKAIDRALNPNEETMESINKVAELAGHCTAREPYQRPDMGHAVSILSPLVEQWKPSLEEEEESYGIDLNLSLPQTVQQWRANEGSSSTLVNDMTYSNSHSSIPSKPSGFADSFDSSDCR